MFQIVVDVGNWDASRAMNSPASPRTSTAPPDRLFESWAADGRPTRAMTLLAIPRRAADDHHCYSTSRGRYELVLEARQRGKWLSDGFPSATGPRDEPSASVAIPLSV